jgi:hypothetical protein
MMSARSTSRTGLRWVHFLVIGAVLFVVRTLHPESTALLIDGPSPERVSVLRGEWLRTTGELPSEAQLQVIIERETDQLLLFEEALRRDLHLTDSVVVRRLIRDMRFIDPDLSQADAVSVMAAAIDLELHRNDPVVRRRLIQRMEQFAYAPIRASDPGEAVLRAMYDDDPSAHMAPAMIEFDHVYFSVDRHENAAMDTTSLAAEWRGRSFADVAQQGDPFIHGNRFGPLTGKQVARYFGQSFADELFLEQAQVAPAPYGPVRSSYGEHLLWINRFRASAVKPFADVRRDILRDWRAQQEQLAVAAQIEALRRQYEIRP